MSGCKVTLDESFNAFYFQTNFSSSGYTARVNESGTRMDGLLKNLKGK